MSCPLGFTEDDGPNPHAPPAFVQPPQRDGRTPPPLPPRPRRAQTKWHESHVKQGPPPAWAAFVSSWYNQLWGLCRALILAGLLLFLTPALHAANWTARRVPLAAPRALRWAAWQPARAVQWLYGGMVAFLFECIAGCIYMFSGQVELSFWEGEGGQADGGGGGGGGGRSGMRTASAVPNAGGIIPAPKAQQAQTNGAAVPAPAPSGPLVTVLVSNQVSQTSFLDCVVFFSLAYRRGQLSALYFLPIDTNEWGLFTRLLAQIFLAPLVVQAEDVARVLARNCPCTFVCFPESTRLEDAVLPVPAEGATPTATASALDLLHVNQPILSNALLQLLLACTTGAPLDVESPRAAATAAATPLRPLSVVEVTIAYSGSVQADLEQKQLDAQAHALDSGALDFEEEDEFERLAAAGGDPDAVADAAADADEGYSAETINNYAHGRITSRRPRKLSPHIEVFCTAAPLRPLDGSESRALSSPSSRAALDRPRIVPSFYAFLSGNAPTNVAVLLNQHDDAYVRRRILQLRGDSNGAASSSGGGGGGGGGVSGAKPAHLSAAEEAYGPSYSRSLSGERVSWWLQQRWLHQEQQLSLYAIHAQFHALPPSLSASSIPVCAPLESFAYPISSVKAAAFMAIDWVVIVATTVVVRNTRAAILAR